MQTNFSPTQLADPDIAVAEKILRSCVHCGFCTATCPTFVTLGDELDSPRGRIYLIKDLLEQERKPTAEFVTHIDRCLSCLACMTTCPSGVHYMHLVDQTRSRIQRDYKRPFHDRLFRRVLAFVLPKTRRFRLALLFGWYGKLAITAWDKGLDAACKALPGFKPRPPQAATAAGFWDRLRAMLAMVPGDTKSPSRVDKPQVFPAEGAKRARVALMNGCAQKVLAPEINEATVRLLTRLGVEVVVAKGSVCCGALVHHMGEEEAALAAAKANVEAWQREIDGEGLDAVIINASGCGTTVKDYGFMLREDGAWAEKAAAVSARTKDISEFLADLGEPLGKAELPLAVAYHAACSLQHGQQVKEQPKDLLRQAGFQVLEPAEGHLCCGSAGTYNILQPGLAERLKAHKLANIERLRPQVIATGNIGCMTQIASGTDIPVVHTVTLLDWANGGPRPEALKDIDTAGL
jgi:glycolate oxidase iron-sulfur subunit